ncbi:hypothetical protein PIB30_082837 [Stylosanthes scabra]|uniref:Uncharacterized protein n=1 Tax=Stylosanthes scabra TaxID=79078 RepID=A0ABU6WUV5_9FABA|nr:hypothetical protein [Stylosanthes scabra]
MIDPLLCLSSWEVKFASREMVKGLDRLPVFLLDMIRETVHWLATGPGQVGLITDLMSLLAVGTGMHHVHLFDIVWHGLSILGVTLIETMADNNQHFKTRVATANKQLFEIAPSESIVLAKSLMYIAAMIKEIKDGQQAAPKLLKHQPSTS